MRKRPWLTRNLVALSAISLTQDAASELMYPLLPLFITGVLVAPPIVVGIVEGFAEVAAGLAKYFSGRASDNRDRRIFISSGYALAGVGKILVASAVAWPMVLIARVVDRLGKGIRSAPRDALLTADIDRNQFGRAFGFHRAADTTGAVLGPLAALYLLAHFDGDLRKVMWWAVLPAALSVLLTFFVRETRKASATHIEPASKTPLGEKFWQTASPLVAVALINVPDTLLLLRVSELGATTTQVVLAYIGFNLVYVLAAYPAGVLSDRIAPNKVYAIGLGAFSLTYLALANLNEVNFWLFVVVAGYGFFPAFTDGIGKSMVSKQVSHAVHGRAQGVFQSLTGGAILIAGIWFGALWDVGAGHGSAPAMVAGISSAIAAILFLWRDWR
jgi:MFS family permease